MLQRRQLRSREVSFCRQSQRKVWLWESAWPMGPASVAHHLFGHWHWAHSSPVVLLLQTSGQLLTRVLSLLPWPLENLYLVTHPPEWQWMLMKMIMEEDERGFSGACAWRYHPHLCFLPQESDFNGRNASRDGRESGGCMVAMLYRDQSLKHLCLTQQPLTLPVERQVTGPSARIGLHAPFPFSIPTTRLMGLCPPLGVGSEAFLTGFQTELFNWPQLVIGMKHLSAIPSVIEGSLQNSWASISPNGQRRK